MVADERLTALQKLAGHPAYRVGARLEIHPAIGELLLLLEQVGHHVQIGKIDISSPCVSSS
jgi:hypothetical protein